MFWHIRVIDILALGCYKLKNRMVIFSFFYLKTKEFKKVKDSLERNHVILGKEHFEKIKIKRAWEKNSNLPSPFSNLI
jgi:hypothetical protein